MTARTLASGLLRELRSRAPNTARYLGGALAQTLRRGSGAREPSSALTVDVVTDDARLAALELPWSALHASSGARSAFASWPWLSGWWTAIGRPAGLGLRVYVARRDGEVLGIAPTYLDGRVLRTLGDAWVGSEHLGLITCDADRAEAARAIADAIAEDTSMDAVDLVDLVEDTAFGTALLEARTVGGVHEVWQTLPFLPLPGSAAAWEQGLSSSMRYNVRRKLKRLDKAYPGARMVCLSDPAQIPAALELLFRLHAARWATKGQTGNFVREDVRAFHHDVAPRLLSAGILRLYQLDLGEGRIGSTLYCLRSGGRELYLQAGLDPAYEGVSAGFCLMARVIAAAADEGVVEFDFLRGTEGYKTHWATASRTTRRVRAARPTARGLAWLAAQRLDEDVRALAKVGLPEAWQGRLRARVGG